MKYIRLTELDNKYPSIDKYTRGTTDGSIVLYGQTPTKQLVFNISDYKTITPVAGTTFRFILAISKDINDTTPKLFTSQGYFDDLADSFKTHNPYFITESFGFKVNFYYNDLLALYTSLSANETAESVQMKQNISINAGVIDYETLVRYIDWCVATANLNDLNTNGVLPANSLGSWNITVPNTTTQTSNVVISPSQITTGNTNNLLVTGSI